MICQRPKREKKLQRTFYLPKTLVRRLRLYSATSGLAQSTIVEAALNAYLNLKEDKEHG